MLLQLKEAQAREKQLQQDNIATELQLSQVQFEQKLQSEQVGLIFLQLFHMHLSCTPFTTLHTLHPLGTLLGTIACCDQCVHHCFDVAVCCCCFCVMVFVVVVVVVMLVVCTLQLTAAQATIAGLESALAKARAQCETAEGDLKVVADMFCAFRCDLMAPAARWLQ